MTTARTTRTSGGKPSRADRQRAAAERAAAARRRTRRRWALGAVAAVAVAALVTDLAVRNDDEGAQAASAPVVGGDLHTLADVNGARYVGGRAAVAVSGDGGRAWEQVPSLEGVAVPSATDGGGRTWNRR